MEFWRNSPNFALFLRNLAVLSCAESEKVTADVCRAMQQGSAFWNFSHCLHPPGMPSFSFPLRSACGPSPRHGLPFFPPSAREGSHDGRRLHQSDHVHPPRRRLLGARNHIRPSRAHSVTQSNPFSALSVGACSRSPTKVCLHQCFDSAVDV